MGKRRLAVLWSTFGPYHVARLWALNRVFELSAIQLYDRESLRGWQGQVQPEGLPVRTVFPGVAEGGVARGVVAGVWRALSEARPEVVLVPGYSNAAALTAAVWAKRNGAAAVLMSDSTEVDRGREGWKESVKGAIVRALFAGGFVAGKRAAAYVRTLAGAGFKMCYRYDVVDNDFFASGCERIRRLGDRAGQGLPQDYFLYVGRLSKEKNLIRLLAAFARYRLGGGQWELVIVGGGPDAKSLHEGVEQSEVADAVHFLGPRPAADLLPCYAWAQCFVLPSMSEPWGLVVNEAMAAGLPVIVSDRCGCVDDLVEPGGNGWLFNPEDVQALTEQLWAVTQLSPEERAAMGQRSREIIAEFTPDHFAEEVSKLICAEKLGY
ncbi:glycosyltransferase family 4 protein [Paludibaculum fermentans]|uniref:Glycosyltransferase n=1 Tax=Paludibaculum fermentans TaxID=1473598 RepID=A0A7S7NK92_PALFE|nr:glycosyltransferase [Paludibaculum fermentans]QOY85095.1 glycosyltransferase [Paludibaculum fermentans]